MDKVLMNVVARCQDDIVDRSYDTVCIEDASASRRVLERIKAVILLAGLGPADAAERSHWPLYPRHVD